MELPFQSVITAEEIEKLPLATFDGQIEVIDKLGERFDKAVNYLRGQKLLGFDTESKPTFVAGSGPNGVALLQLSAKKRVYLFKIKEIELPLGLRRVLSNPKIVKVGAAVHDDIRCLQKVAKFKANSFVDLQNIVEEWGVEEKSLRKMTAIILGRRLSKGQQLSNWENKKLTPAQINYAALDAVVCEEIYLRLLATAKVI